MYQGTKINKIFFGTLILIGVFVIVATYQRVYVDMNYFVIDEVPCDPISESCFLYTPEEICEENEALNCEDQTEVKYYKIIHKKAYNVANCQYDSESEEDCRNLMCDIWESEKECFYQYCDDGCATKIQ